ncbi:MAG: FliA/WhiG family RNA polymerase sigma factor [Halanaerobiales bacterium]|nr:FliA/WhiG family RNA polymerase sigma factor [Halanaerobiales bacterium]
MKKKKVDETELWKLVQKGDLQARNYFIEEYTSLVKYVAGRVKMIVPMHIEFDDLVSFGVFGLIRAIESFKPELGVKFSTYAVVRIRGAILDELRSQDWVSRSSRQKAKKLAKVYHDLEQKLGKNPEDEEIAEELGLTLEEYHKFILEANIPELTSLHSFIGSNSDSQLMDMISDENDRPDMVVNDKEIRDILGETIDRLKDQEKLVIALYYYEELTQVEIAHVLNLSPARVSQIHSKAILRMRGMLSRKRALFF